MFNVKLRSGFPVESIVDLRFFFLKDIQMQDKVNTEFIVGKVWYHWFSQ